MRKVVVSGYFDPLHIGHLHHMKLARALGDWLTVIVNTDASAVAKKGYVFMPLFQRVEIVKELRCVDEVVTQVDKDGTVTETLKMIKPDIFAEGGDRTPDNMPQNEVDVCREIGCQIVYGVGEQLDSSTNLVKRMLNTVAGGAPAGSGPETAQQG